MSAEEFDYTVNTIDMDPSFQFPYTDEQIAHCAIMNELNDYRLADGKEPLMIFVEATPEQAEAFAAVHANAVHKIVNLKEEA